MATTAKKKLTATLTDRLRLREPEFHLERLGGKLCGSIISDSFRGVDSRGRQKKIWDALAKEFGDDSRSVVGVLFAYTKDEWNVPLEGDPAYLKKQRKTKKR